MEATLEELIDTQSLTDVLAAIARICEGKSEHLLANWQDKPASKDWDSAASRIWLAHDYLAKRTHL
jgi:hypothetical protein